MTLQHWCSFKHVTWWSLHHYIVKALISAACRGQSLPDFTCSDCPTGQQRTVSDHLTFLLHFGIGLALAEWCLAYEVLMVVSRLSCGDCICQLSRVIVLSPFLKLHGLCCLSVSECLAVLARRSPFVWLRGNWGRAGARQVVFRSIQAFGLPVKKLAAPHRRCSPLPIPQDVHDQSERRCGEIKQEQSNDTETNIRTNP